MNWPTLQTATSSSPPSPPPLPAPSPCSATCCNGRPCSERRGDDEEGGGGMVGGLAMAIIAPIAAMLIQMAVSRSREYLADEAGARICGNPLSLANALSKLHNASQMIPMQDARPATAHLFIVNPLRRLAAEAFLDPSAHGRAYRTVGGHDRHARIAAAIGVANRISQGFSHTMMRGVGTGACCQKKFWQHNRCIRQGGSYMEWFNGSASLVGAGYADRTGNSIGYHDVPHAWWCRFVRPETFTGGLS